MSNKYKFNKIARDIKSIKIQGATNLAKAAIYAYRLTPTKESKKKLLSLRPTEPLLINILNHTDTLTYKEVLGHFSSSQKQINKNTLKIIKQNSIIFTHCHSTAVVKSLIYAKKKGKKFQVYLTETRPLFQGRITAKELEKANIKVTMFMDSAAAIAISRCDMVFFGADAILKKGVMNKIGSGMFSQIAKQNKKPVYVIADSWKYTPKNIKIEERDFHEAWKKAPKNIKIKNPAFEFIKRKYIKAIISEYGILSYRKFLKQVKKRKFD